MLTPKPVKTTKERSLEVRKLARNQVSDKEKEASSPVSIDSKILSEIRHSSKRLSAMTELALS